MNPEGRAGAISRFFINRPVLANVLALVFVLIGLVALFNLPSSQYPNVVPPTVQVTTRYPGASAMTLVDTVALPIEQNVNGVENMIYMQSTSASDGTYSLDRHLRDRHQPRRGRDPGPEPGVGGDFVAAAGSAAPGRDDQEAVDLDPRVRRSRSRPTAASTACSCRTTPSSTCRTSFAASPASATCRCSAPGNTPCASG